MADNTIWFGCDISHDHICHVEVIRKVEQVFRNTWKVYAIVHVVPVILFKSKMIVGMVKKKQWKEIFQILTKTLKGFFKSMSFLSLYTLFAMFTWCY